MSIISQTTEGITVSVEPRFDGDLSEPNGIKYLFSYTITIYNQLPYAVQLLSRQWEIFDSIGHSHEVVGEGVVGQKPVIPPNEEFVYASWCPLDSPLGTMQGKYKMKNLETDALFEIFIPKFELSSDWIKN